MMCANGACSGNACCTNACTNGGTQTVECARQTCQVAANGCTVWSAPVSSCSGGLVCERNAAGPTCEDPNWAEWHIPNSAADTGTPNTASYTDNGNGTVTDNVTKLMWQKTVSMTTSNQDQAVMLCDALSLGGYSDWRLPSQIELVSLVDYGASSPAINATFFPDTPIAGNGLFWSSTLVAGAPSTAWFVAFAFGGTFYESATVAHFVRCVR
jgi:hypothetical protein